MDFAEFKVEFTDEPGVVRKVWLFSLVLGHSRWLWGRFVSSQNLQTVMRCHIAAFGAMGGAPEEILYDRMKTAVIGEDDAGIVAYNTSLVALLKHYGCAPKACKPYRAHSPPRATRTTISGKIGSKCWTRSHPDSGQIVLIAKNFQSTFFGCSATRIQ